MPRSSTSPAGKIVHFFRSADLPTADVVLDLCKDEVAARHQRSNDAKARANTGKRGSKKKKAKKPTAAAIE